MHISTVRCPLQVRLIQHSLFSHISEDIVGAADDALSVGVMIECLRVLVESPEWKPSHAIVFLFNHAEESLQDGSQLFSTQHPVTSTSVLYTLLSYRISNNQLHRIRAVINLEGRNIALIDHISQHIIAAGTMGPTLLFQATSEEMIRAYPHVPRYQFSTFSNHTILTCLKDPTAQS